MSSDINKLIEKECQCFKAALIKAVQGTADKEKIETSDKKQFQPDEELFNRFKNHKITSITYGNQTSAYSHAISDDTAKLLAASLEMWELLKGMCKWMNTTSVRPDGRFLSKAEQILSKLKGK